MSQQRHRGLRREPEDGDRQPLNAQLNRHSNEATVSTPRRWSTPTSRILSYPELTHMFIGSRTYVHFLPWFNYKIKWPQIGRYGLISPTSAPSTSLRFSTIKQGRPLKWPTPKNYEKTIVQRGDYETSDYVASESFIFIKSVSVCGAKKALLNLLSVRQCFQLPQRCCRRHRHHQRHANCSGYKPWCCLVWARHYHHRRHFRSC